MSQPKETHFFNKNYEKGLGWYKKCFSDPESMILGDFTPWYMLDENSSKRIHALFPDATILVILREPLERVLNHLLYDYYRLEKKPVTIESIKALSTAFSDGRYRKQSMYHSLLKNYYDVFDPSQIKIFFIEDLKADPESFLARLYDSVGFKLVPPEECDPTAQINMAAPLKSTALYNTLKCIKVAMNRNGVLNNISTFLENKLNIGHLLYRCMAKQTTSEDTSFEFVDIFDRKEAVKIVQDALRIEEFGVSIPAVWKDVASKYL